MKTVRVVRSLSEVRSLAPKSAAVTLGVFDGVHRGHGRIIEELVRARDNGEADSCFVITFDPHPLVVTHSRITPPMLTTIVERIALLSRFALDGIVVLTFDEELAATDYRTFLDRYLRRPFDMKVLVLGYDCRFGRNREGTPERAMEASGAMGFSARVVPAVSEGSEIVSSTNIRNALMEGDLAAANHSLGHPYLISGKVVHGHGRGEGFGFPTANLAINHPHKLWPPRGVYAVRVERAGEKLDGMMNVGRAPTVKSLGASEHEIEIHLFEFNGDLYGESLMVECHAYLRDERKFPSVEALVKQLAIDRSQAVARLAVAG